MTSILFGAKTLLVEPVLSHMVTTPNKVLTVSLVFDGLQYHIVGTIDCLKGSQAIIAIHCISDLKLATDTFQHAVTAEIQNLTKYYPHDSHW